MAKNNIVFGIVAAIMFAGFGFNAVRQEDRINDLEGRITILRSYNVKNIENQLRDMPSRYQLGQVAELVDTKADSSQLTAVRNSVEWVQTRVSMVDLKIDVAWGQAFHQTARQALAAADRGDLERAKTLAISAFAGVQGLECTHGMALYGLYAQDADRIASLATPEYSVAIDREGTAHLFGNGAFGC